MTTQPLIKTWAMQIRAPFLLLAALLVLIGGAAAHAAGAFDPLRFLLALVGTVLAHVSVNLFNEHSDHRTRIDEHTTKTPFSGGSGMMQQGHTSPRAVLLVASTTLLVAFVIGVYLASVSSWWLLAFVIPGALATVLYTSHLAKVLMGELAAGLTLGTFVVLGTYFSMTGTLALPVVLASVTPGILTALLLLLNEFPDMEADQAGGRYHLVIALGRRKAALVYTGFLMAGYLLIVGAVLWILGSTGRVVGGRKHWY